MTLKEAAECRWLENDVLTIIEKVLDLQDSLSVSFLYYYFDMSSTHTKRPLKQKARENKSVSLRPLGNSDSYQSEHALRYHLRHGYFTDQEAKTTGSANSRGRVRLKTDTCSPPK